MLNKTVLESVKKELKMKDSHSVSMVTKRLPEPGYSRLPTVLSIFPISRSRWYAAIQTGHIKRPVKMCECTAAWSNEYLNGLLDRIENGEQIV